MGKTEWVYRSILPAMQCPFTTDLRIDEPELRRLTAWLAGHRGIGGLVTNGHTGEVFALSAKQRAEVTRIVADEVKGALPVVSGINCEGIAEACEHAAMAKEAGASGLLVMPPHMWLRFGMRPEHVVDYFTAIGKSSGLDLVVHIYPAWTRAGYSFEILAGLATLPWVKCFKIGTREMNKYACDLQAIRAVAPHKALLTCHDEYLLASMVQGIDGALVGFATLIPDLIQELLDAVAAGDLRTAMKLQSQIDPLKDVVYGDGEPTGEAHACMKAAMAAAGLIDRATVRPPTVAPNAAELGRIHAVIESMGLRQRAAG